MKRTSGQLHKEYPPKPFKNIRGHLRPFEGVLRGQKGLEGNTPLPLRKTLEGICGGVAA